MLTVTTSLLLCAAAAGGPDLVVTPVPSGRYEAFRAVFTQHVDVFGVRVFGTRGAPADKVLHTATVLAEYLDNDEDGDADNPRVLAELVRRGAFMAVAASEREMESLDFGALAAAGFDAGQGQFAAETAPGGRRFDATLEEVLHLITHEGYARVYPEVFGEREGTVLADCLDRARGGRFGDVPASYPEGAWFTYDDASCDYGCQCTEYLYWAITSVLGAQEAAWRRREIAHEWRLPTAALVQARDPAIYALVTDPAYRLPRRCPDGRYQPGAGAGGEVEVLPRVAGKKSGEPELSVGPDGVVHLSWIEPRAGGHALVFATLLGDRWSAPQEVARGENWFVNWADFPAVRALPGGRLVAHWRQMRGAGTYDYDVMVSRSDDGGEGWSEPARPHRDGVAAEHGFVSLAPRGDGRVALAWLDGREMAGGHGHGRGDMTLRYAEWTASGELEAEALLDARVCECCQTSMANTSNGPLVVYRDRSSEEVRDISCVRLVDGRWTEPHKIATEKWEIAGCPVNGPSVAAQGDNVVVAYFTAAGGKASVRLVRSDDAGESFGAPVVVDDENPPGRVEVLLDDNGDAWVCWLGSDAGGEPGEGAVLLARVGSDGALGDVRVIAKTGAGRSNGFPQVAMAGDALLFAWTDGGVQTARLRRR